MPRPLPTLPVTLLATLSATLLATLVLAPPAWPAGEKTLDPVQDYIVVTTRPVRAGTVLGPEDVALVPSPLQGLAPGTLQDPEAAVGREARATLYPGRPIAASQLGDPALVERNALVGLRFETGLLSIAVEGRALDRGAAGETVRVMNLASRTIVTGRIAPDGVVDVGAATAELGE